MTRSTLSLIAASFKRFNGDKCWTSAVVISYFALLCSVPLIALFFAAAARRLPLSSLGFYQYLSPTLQLLCGVLLLGGGVRGGSSPLGLLHRSGVRGIGGCHGLVVRLPESQH